MTLPRPGPATPRREAVACGRAAYGTALDGLSMPALSEVLSLREAQLFVGRERELALFRHWLEAEPSDPVILNVSGPGGVGKSMLLRAFRQIALERCRPVVLADSAAFPATPAGLALQVRAHDIAAVPEWHLVARSGRVPSVYPSAPALRGAAAAYRAGPGWAGDRLLYGRAAVPRVGRALTR